MEKVLLANDFMVNGKKVFKTDVPERRSGKFQYESIIYWWHWSFSEEFINLLDQEKYRGVEGINIVPYRFCEKDIVDAVSNKDRNFQEECSKNPAYVDFHGATGNYHKKPDGVFQVVITRGPSGPKFISGKMKGTLEATRVYDYFPAIKKDNSNETNNIRELIWMAINAMFNESRKMKK